MRKKILTEAQRKERKKIANEKYRAENKDKINAYVRAYHKKHRDRINAQSRARYKKNNTKQKAAKIRWQLANPEKYKAMLRASSYKSYHKNIEASRAKGRARYKLRTAEQKQKDHDRYIEKYRKRHLIIGRIRRKERVKSRKPKNVYWNQYAADRGRKPWKVQFGINGRDRTCGVYWTKKEAKEAAKILRAKLKVAPPGSPQEFVYSEQDIKEVLKCLKK